MTTAARPARTRSRLFGALADYALIAPPGTFAVDQLKLPYGRGALADAARAAAKAEFHHSMKMSAPARDEALRVALHDAIDAAERIMALANLSSSGRIASELIVAAREQLEGLAPTGSNRRGSPGRPVERAAAEAAAQIWAKAEGRGIPRAGIKEQEHPLAILFRAISKDMFGRPVGLSGACLRPLRK